MTSKSWLYSRIEDLLREGKEVNEIAAQLNVSQGYVYRVKREISGVGEENGGAEIPTPAALERERTEAEFGLACREAKSKFDRVVEEVWKVYHQARDIGGLSRVEARLKFREVIRPAETDYLQDLGEAGTRRSQVLTEWVRPR